jgi:hypothetical protein
MKHWHKAAIIFSVAWLILMGLYVGVSAYHQFACTPSVENLPDGTIVRHSCINSGVSREVVLHTAGYLAAGVVVIWALSWLFLGWPSDIVSRFFGYPRGRSE